MAFKDEKRKISYNNEFNKNAYDRISLMLRKGKKELIQQRAQQNGESVNAFINRAIDLLLDSPDQAPTDSEQEQTSTEPAGTDRDGDQAVGGSC